MIAKLVLVQRALLARLKLGGPSAETRLISLMYGAIFSVYGLHVPYLAVWLASRGIDPSETGWILSLPLFVRLVATPAIAMSADAAGRHSATIFWLSIIGLGATLVLGIAPAGPIVAVGVLVMLVSLQSTMPLIEVVALRNAGSGHANYGRQRLWGSVTFIAFTLVGGLAIAEFGGWVVQPLLVLATLLLVAAASALNLAEGPKVEHSHLTGLDASNASASGLAVRSIRMAAERLHAIRPVLMRPGLVGGLIAAGVIQASHAVYYVFSALHWQSMGFSGLWIGLLWSLGVLAEIILFARSGDLVRSIGPSGLLLLGAAAALVRWTVMAFDPGPVMLIPLQLLHAFTFGATHLAAMLFIARVVPGDHAGTVQALYGTFATGIAMGLATLLAGYLYAEVREQSYLAMALVGVAATIYGAWIIRRPVGPACNAS